MIRLGLCGCGAMGAYHVKKFRLSHQVEWAACYDRDRTKAEAFARQWNIPRVASSLEELAGWCDALSCALVDRAHEKAAQTAAQFGKPLFLEKPMAMNAEESSQILDLFLTAGLPLVINFSKRNAPLVQGARSLLEQGALGTLTGLRFSYRQSWLVDDAWGVWREQPRWRWRTSEEESCHGVVGDLVCHLLDACAAIVPQGDQLVLNTARGRRTPREDTLGGAWCEAVVEGHLTVSGRKVPIVFEASQAAAGFLDSMTARIEGTEGILDLDWENHRESVTLHMASKPSQVLSFPPVETTYEAFVAQLVPTRPDTARMRSGHRIQVLLDDIHRLLLAQEGS